MKNTPTVGTCFFLPANANAKLGIVNSPSNKIISGLNFSIISIAFLKSSKCITSRLFEF